MVDLISYVTPNGARKPRKEQLILWQCAMGLLEFSIYFWLAGFLVFLWDWVQRNEKIERSHGAVVSSDDLGWS
jgi:hypothetical protein